MKLVLASRNRHKIDEIKRVLSDSGINNVEILSLDDIGYLGEIEENGTTFEENALIKARFAAQSGYIGIGDDSGLCVEALGGEPGIYSARYAGEDATDADRCSKVLSELEGVDISMRSARFACALYCIIDDDTEYSVLGTMNGFIGTEPMGENGFGYDPIFMIDEETSVAMISDEEKNKISHRAEAMRKLAEVLKANA